MTNMAWRLGEGRSGGDHVVDDHHGPTASSCGLRWSRPDRREWLFDRFVWISPISLVGFDV